MGVSFLAMPDDSQLGKTNVWGVNVTVSYHTLSNNDPWTCGIVNSKTKRIDKDEKGGQFWKRNHVLRTSASFLSQLKIYLHSVIQQRFQIRVIKKPVRRMMSESFTQLSTTRRCSSDLNHEVKTHSNAPWAAINKPRTYCKICQSRVLKGTTRMCALDFLYLRLFFRLDRSIYYKASGIQVECAVEEWVE